MKGCTSFEEQFEELASLADRTAFRIVGRRADTDEIVGDHGQPVGDRRFIPDRRAARPRRVPRVLGPTIRSITAYDSEGNVLAIDEAEIWDGQN